jgi:hypothetical protein
LSILSHLRPLLSRQIVGHHVVLVETVVALPVAIVAHHDAGVTIVHDQNFLKR